MGDLHLQEVDHFMDVHPANGPDEILTKIHGVIGQSAFSRIVHLVLSVTSLLRRVGRFMICFSWLQKW